MWTYSQTTGTLSQDGTFVASGYSGRDVPGGPQGRNNPELESMPNVGPIPRGNYAIGTPVPVPNHAPPVFPLTPVGHDAHGRSGFLIHGNNVHNDASRGCIILDYPYRRLLEESLSADRSLEVTS